MPTTIEDLEAAIQDTTSQANSILFVNHNVLEQYENRERQVSFQSFFLSISFCFQPNFKWLSVFVTTKQIGTLATKLEEDKKEVSRCLAEIDTLKVSNSDFMNLHLETLH